LWIENGLSGAEPTKKTRLSFKIYARTFRHRRIIINNFFHPPLALLNGLFLCSSFLTLPGVPKSKGGTTGRSEDSHKYKGWLEGGENAARKIYYILFIKVSLIMKLQLLFIFYDVAMYYESQLDRFAFHQHYASININVKRTLSVRACHRLRRIIIH
jgi:hypothetical protein